MPRQSGVLAMVATLFLASMAGGARAQDSASKKEEPGAVRLREMAGLARAVAIKGEDRKPAEVVPDPIFRYNDQPRRIEDATLWLFGHPGRPAAALKVEIYPDRGLYGLVALAPGTIHAEGPDWRWDSTAPGIELRPIPGAPAPSETPRERLTQLRALAARFSGFEFEPARGRLQMRLLPRPIARYEDPGSGLQDGAIFTLSYGVNPEVLILLESRQAPGAAAPTWQFGLGRLGGAEVSVSLDNQEVWKQPVATPVPQTRPTYMNRFLKRPEVPE